jgi:hypothetical protein
MRNIAASLLAANPFHKSYINKSYPKNKYISRYVCGMRVIKTKPAYVYYIKIEFADVTVWKIGYTSTSVRSRIAWMCLDNSIKVTVITSIKCSSAAKAFYLEQLLHKRFKDFKYNGINLLNSGNTELYSVPLV